jgi:hypothetical protein
MLTQYVYCFARFEKVRKESSVISYQSSVLTLITDNIDHLT